MKLIYTIFIAAMATITGCTTTKVLQATGGSKSDGVVELSYQVGMFENPVIDWAQAEAIATDRCEAWDYNNAEAFGGGTTQCQAFNGYGSCMRSLVTIKYQCLD